MNLIVTNDPDTKFVSEAWIKEFMSIPPEYRTNPFEVSPSGDLFFADRRNIEHIDKALAGQTKGYLKKKEKNYLPHEITRHKIHN